ncbi:MAG: DUF1998 domain-containing protein [Planctomycetes bacterium]|nr:DUF1998 domain-containing protein [Planctomycetota bacterium]
MSHDRAYFADPLKLLAGRVDPPAFNLRNELMVAKHVHASVITRLHQYVREARRPASERASIEATLKSCLPNQVSVFLFDAGTIRSQPFDFTPLRELVTRNLEDLVSYVVCVFTQGWPADAASVVQPDVLRETVSLMVGRLEDVVARLSGRLKWALAQITRLNRLREQHGTLEPEDEALFRRCDGLLKRLKGTARRSRREAEGYDDVNTFGVLAAEGFLPGYGLEVGSVLGTAEIPFWRMGAMEFALPRPPSVALREYVPGNLIYANGNRFVARRFHRDVDEHRIEIPNFEVSTERQAVKLTTAGSTTSSLGSTALPAIAVCDVDLVHQSHISDEEELRFQMGVATYGMEREQHEGGVAYAWGPQAMHHRHGVRLRLVNVGASAAIERLTRPDRFGYPVCTVCGQSVSPLSTDEQRRKFAEGHLERCGRKVTPVGFYADVVADVLSLPACPNHATAFSVLEAIRFAATHVLDMHMEDLQVLVIGHVDRDDVDALLWDPMPGGSGLLDQLCERFTEIVAAAREVVEKCPSACTGSCIDCLQTFRNGFYHKHLDRKVALQCLDAWGRTARADHEIPKRQPTVPSRDAGQPVNESERRLRHLLAAAGFEDGLRNEQVRLDRSIGTTTPDVIYRNEDHGPDEGICVYLDGLSGHLHGNAQTREQDQRIRSWLRNHGWEVIEISAVELDDPDAMTRHFRKLAGYLGRSSLKASLAADRTWYERARSGSPSHRASSIRIESPSEPDRYRTCVPLVPLKAAAGGFGDPQFIEDGQWDWVAIDSRRSLRPGMFVAQVIGRSMEPLIPDGSHCLFQAPVTGSRQGRVVLVALRDDRDPETDERFTVKRYESSKAVDDDGVWRHVTVTLKPQNHEFKAIELTCHDEGSVRVVAEFLEVVDAPTGR